MNPEQMLAITQTNSMVLLANLGIVAPWFAVPLAAAVLVVVVVALVVSKSRRGRLNKLLPIKFRNSMGRQQLRLAQKAEKAGRKFDAAGHYAKAGLVDKAVALYQSDGKTTSAADTLIEVGRIEDAADLYRVAGKFDKAGDLYKQAEKLKRAAECFDSAGNALLAAQAWETVGELEAAGDRYQQFGDLAKAARAFERAGLGQKYVAAFVPWWESELDRQAGVLEPPAYWSPAIEKAADEAEAIEDWPSVLKLSGYLGRWHAAAVAAEAIGQWEDAKRFYHSSGDLEGVARMADKLGVSDEAWIARGEAAEKAGKLGDAAEFFEQAGQPERALPLYMGSERWTDAARVAESLEQFEDAASAWGKAGEHRKVADIYFRLERWEPAGSAYEAAEELELAAESYRKAENWLQAARVWETGGKTQPAIQDLQQHLRRVGQDREVSLKLVELMMVEGMRSTALGILEPMVTMQPTNNTEADSLYKYGMLLEEEGRNREAAQAYDRLLAFDVAYRDARARAEKTRNLPDRSATSGTQSGRQGGQTQSSTASSLAGTTSGDPFAPMGGFSPVESPLEQSDGGATQQILDRYVPQGELGRGGMGVVVKAHDKMLDRMVAIKLVKAPGANTNQMDKILNEARATAKLNHPNIVQIYDCALAQGNFMMAMEYVEGQTVKDLIQAEGVLPATALILIFGQIAKGLQYAHDNGIVHRDIKPANILWTEDKRVKITDFGLARAAQELSNTQTVVVGSPYYMAPEQLMGNLMDHRVDIYALGVSLYEASTGQLPFPKGDVGYHHVHSQPQDPREIRPTMSEDTAILILDMLAKKPEDRPADCGIVLERLRSIIKK